MNYYSRNSPIKRRKYRPPGFLLTPKTAYTPKSTSRSRIKSQFQISRHVSIASQYNKLQKQQQILILDDDVLYVPDNSQIFIQESNQSSQLDIPQLNQYNIGMESQQLEEELNKRFNVIEIQDNKRQIIINKNVVNDYKVNKDQIEESKQFFRNYSFGDKKQQNVTQNLKEPYIKKLINMQSLPELQNKLRKSKASSDTSSKQILKQELQLLKKQPEQVWSKLVKNFIKKRQNSERQRIRKQRIKNKIKNQNQQQKANIYVQLPNPNQELEISSQGSAYFDVKHQNYQPQNQGNNYHQIEHPIISSMNNEIKIQDDQISQKSSNHTYVDTSKNQQQIQKLQTQRNQQKMGYASTMNLLQQIIKQLPQQLIPKYTAIYNQLTKKQQQSQITLNKMKQTIEMIRILIDCHKKMIYVDDYLLDEQEKSQEDEKIVLNREIILSLVRKLANFV